MKKTLKQLVLIFTGCMLISSLNAQTDVRIIDFSVLPMINFNAPAGDSVKLDVRFKINKANEAVKANLWFGTAKDSSNIFIAQPVFNTVGGTTSFIYNGVSQVVQGYEISFPITLSNAQYNGYVSVTLFVETVTGQTTTKLYYKK